MKSNLLAKTLQIAKSLALPALASLAITGCGGGGGGSGTTQIAPSSMDGVQLRLFDAFTLQFQKRGGTAGNETGAALYSPSTESFRYASTQGGVGRDVIIPDPGSLDGMTYTYTRNSPTTGTITLNFNCNQIYPHDKATASNPSIIEGNMFWGGDGLTHTFPDDSTGILPKQTKLTLGVLFAEVSGSINRALTVSVEHYSDYVSTYTNPGPSKEQIYQILFDTKTANFTLSSGGGSLPIGYAGPLYATGESYTGIWKSLSNPKRNIIFFGTTYRRIRSASTTNAPPIPINNLGALPILDSGINLIDVPSENVVKLGGNYSYATTGGTNAKLTIQYNNKTVHYDLSFTSATAGTYTNSEGDSGAFIEDTFTDNPTN